jgi:hypothetical protein
MEKLAIAPRLTDRAVLIGQTGSGKTTLARALLAPRLHVAVYDAKGLLAWPGYERFTDIRHAIESKAQRIIYAPNASELRDPDLWEAFFRWVFLRKNTTLYVDEVYSVTERDNVPDSLHACITRGRELGISTFCSTQRPKLIPQIVLSESEHYYIFRLLLPQDRMKIRQVIGLDDEKLSTLGKYEFYYANNEGETLGPLRLSLDGRDRK